ncbi:MFS general substrate transporter [Punctularia strigosozonata HHB-11173 SS5]|uniref:MFS general substrate transporter n=1 Tax=Punctularia strigosozonata (strain HHB-11173) TaxID=741275 RepID=UPI0004416EC4|nr:MFS general substrate transporter [Punctularia strigosozonata HHB-11173 SS5]EIN07050.1 MFS general substrate transporter [Punctularia strigosozonata HHB-11173 SS5]
MSNIGSLDEKHVPIQADVQDVDVAAQLTAGKEVILTPEEAARIRKKIDWHILPLMFVLYLIQYADKTTLGQAAVLGIIKDAHLNQNQFNWLGTIFYLSFLVFEYPQNLALQRFPVGKWMSVNIFIWGVALACHAACKSFGALFACRFILGMCEGAITPGFMLVTSMFYTRDEQTRRTGFWFLMNGSAIIVMGFLAFGTLHIKSGSVMPWQWLVIIMGILTIITSVLFWFFFPDSPTNAHFLTPDERVMAIERIKSNQAGVENKKFKREQMIEAFTDPKTWLFALFAAIENITNSLSNQRQLIVNLFGFTPIQTTLLGCVDGVVEIISIAAGVTIATAWKNGRGYTAVLFFVPAILGAILVNTLPSHNRVGLLFSYWISITEIVPFVIILSWVTLTTAGHTKRVTVNAIVLCAYAVGNAAGPFMWKKKYQPRNHVPWAIIAACSFASGIIALVIRFVLARENKRRDASGTTTDSYDDVYLTSVKEDGTTTERHVDRVFLDLTDRQNQEFRYVL